MVRRAFLCCVMGTVFASPWTTIASAQNDPVLLIRSFIIKGAFDNGDPRSPARGTFQVWWHTPSQFVRVERVTWLKSKGLEAGQPAEETNVKLGFSGNTVIFDGAWPGSTDTIGGAPVARAPTQETLAELLPSIHQDCASLLNAVRSPLSTDVLDDRVKTNLGIWRLERPQVLSPGVSSLSRALSSVRYSDDRPVDGFLVPYLGQQGTATGKVSEFKVNVDIDPRVFKN